MLTQFSQCYATVPNFFFLFFRYLYDCEIVYSDGKLNPHNIGIVQFIEVTCNSNKFNNKLKQHLSESWYNFVSNFNTLFEYKVKRNFIAVNQLLLECHIFSPVVNKPIYILRVILKSFINT